MTERWEESNDSGQSPLVGNCPDDHHNSGERAALSLEPFRDDLYGPNVFDDCLLESAFGESHDIAPVGYTGVLDDAGAAADEPVLARLEQDDEERHGHRARWCHGVDQSRAQTASLGGWQQHPMSAEPPDGSGRLGQEVYLQDDLVQTFKHRQYQPQQRQFQCTQPKDVGSHKLSPVVQRLQHGTSLVEEAVVETGMPTLQGPQRGGPMRIDNLEPTDVSELQYTHAPPRMFDHRQGFETDMQPAYEELGIPLAAEQVRMPSYVNLSRRNPPHRARPQIPHNQASHGYAAPDGPSPTSRVRIQHGSACQQNQVAQQPGLSNIASLSPQPNDLYHSRQNSHRLRQGMTFERSGHMGGAVHRYRQPHMLQSIPELTQVCDVPPVEGMAYGPLLRPISAHPRMSRRRSAGASNAIEARPRRSRTVMTRRKGSRKGTGRRPKIVKSKPEMIDAGESQKDFRGPLGHEFPHRSISPPPDIDDRAALTGWPNLLRRTNFEGFRRFILNGWTPDEIWHALPDTGRLGHESEPGRHWNYIQKSMNLAMDSMESDGLLIRCNRKDKKNATGGDGRSTKAVELLKRPEIEGFIQRMKRHVKNNGALVVSELPEQEQAQAVSIASRVSALVFDRSGDIDNESLSEPEDLHGTGMQPIATAAASNAMILDMLPGAAHRVSGGERRRVLANSLKDARQQAAGLRSNIRARYGQTTDENEVSKLQLAESAFKESRPQSWLDPEYHHLGTRERSSSTSLSGPSRHDDLCLLNYEQFASYQPIDQGQSLHQLPRTPGEVDSDQSQREQGHLAPAEEHDMLIEGDFLPQAYTGLEQRPIHEPYAGADESSTSFQAFLAQYLSPEGPPDGPPDEQQNV